MNKDLIDWRVELTLWVDTVRDQKMKVIAETLETEIESVGVLAASKTLAVRALIGNWENCRRGVIINTHIATLDLNLKPLDP